MKRKKVIVLCLLVICCVGGLSAAGADEMATITNKTAIVVESKMSLDERFNTIQNDLSRGMISFEDARHNLVGLRHDLEAMIDASGLGIESHERAGSLQRLVRVNHLMVRLIAERAKSLAREIPKDVFFWRTGNDFHIEHVSGASLQILEQIRPSLDRLHASVTEESMYLEVYAPEAVAEFNKLAQLIARWRMVLCVSCNLWSVRMEFSEYAACFDRLFPAPSLFKPDDKPSGLSAGAVLIQLLELKKKVRSLIKRVAQLPFSSSLLDPIQRLLDNIERLLIEDKHNPHALLAMQPTMSRVFMEWAGQGSDESIGETHFVGQMLLHRQQVPPLDEQQEPSFDEQLIGRCLMTFSPPSNQ